MDPIVLTGLLLSVLLGGMVVILLKPGEYAIKQMLTFSGAYLLSVCVLDLIPETYSSLGRSCGLFLMIGFLVQLLLGYYSKGMEHGHMDDDHNGHEDHDHDHGQILSAGMMISLYAHALFEGLALSEGAGHNHFGNSLLIGIILHKIPIAIVITTIMIKLGTPKIKLFRNLFLFAICAPLGSLLGANLDLTAWMGDLQYEMILAVVVGMLLHISTIILFETSHDHKYNSRKLLTILSGMGIALLSYLS